MKKFFISLVAAMMLAMTFAVPASAADTYHLASKPINGLGFGTGSTCHATIYGKVNNQMVLFIPWHCSGSPGKVWYGPTGQRIGVTGPWLTNISNSVTDMAWIVLDPGNHPAQNLHMIRVGSSTYYNTAKVPALSVSCNSFSVTDTLRTGYWPSNSNSQGAWSSYAIAIVHNSLGGCDITTNFDHGLGSHTIPSGAALWNLTRQQFVGDAKSRDGQNRMVYASWREPMVDLRNYYGATYTYFCANTGCT